MQEKARYNIVLMGKTGVGKSTLGNYLFGNNEFKTGVGKPVTSNGFHSLQFDLQGLPVTVFDSWGIEAGKADQWLRELNTELLKRSTASDPTHWFHSVFYCIQASGHRIEDFEIKIINKFIKENYKVTVVFTKSDNATDDELDDLKNVLSREFGKKVDTVEVCSEEKTRRDGSISKSFGRNQLVDSIFLNFWNSISIRLPERCIAIMHQKVNDWHNSQSKYIENESGYFNDSELKSKIKNSSKDFFDNLAKGFVVMDEVNKTLKMYSFFGQKLNTLSINNFNSNFLDNVNLQNRSWLYYFPTNFFGLLFWGRSDTEIRLQKFLTDICNEMESKINKMLPNVIKMVAGLKPEMVEK